MDAGVLPLPPQFLFSMPDGSAHLTYGSNGQFQVSPGGPSEQREVPPQGDTGSSSGAGASVSNESSMQESRAVTEQRATPSQPPVSFTSSTPSPTQGQPLTTTTGSVSDSLFYNQIPTLSPRTSLPLFRISTEARGSSRTSSFRPLSTSKPVSLPSFFQSKSGSVSSSPTAPLSSDTDCARYFGYPCSSAANIATMESSAVTPLITISPAVPAKVSSSGVQPASWYLAVIFGTIGGVALLIFFITIIAFVYRKAKRRRMAQNVDVPWASTPGDEEDGRLFFGSRDLSGRSVNAAINLGHGRLRSSDHDLDIPVNQSNYTLQDHPIPGSRLFFDDANPPKSEKLTSENHPRPTTNALRLLPSHLVDEELAARAIRGDGAPFSGRLAGLRRRSGGHLDDAIGVNPYVNPLTQAEPLNPIKNERGTASAALKHQPLIDRLRNLGNQGKEQPGSWDRLPTPGRDQSKEEREEPWASSFKISFLNAFNALTSGLKSSGENGPGGDRLTRLPTRHKPSVRRSDMDIPRRASTKPPTWILHEKGDGTGTVEFLPRLEKQYGSRTPGTPEKLPVGSFGRGTDEKLVFQPTERQLYPRGPILPAAAVHPHLGKHRLSPTKRNPISRDSSVYSTSSSATPKCDPPAALLSRRLTSIPVLDQHSGLHDDLDVVVLLPDVFST